MILEHRWPKQKDRSLRQAFNYTMKPYLKNNSNLKIKPVNPPELTPGRNYLQWLVPSESRLLPLTGHILVPFKVRARPNKGILLQLLTFLKAWV